MIWTPNKWVWLVLYGEKQVDWVLTHGVQLLFHLCPVNTHLNLYRLVQTGILKGKWISFLVSDKSASMMWVFCPPWLWHSKCDALLPFLEYVYKSLGFTTLLRTTNVVLGFIYQIFFILTLSPSASFWPPSPLLFCLAPRSVGWACRAPGWLGW